MADKSFEQRAREHMADLRMQPDAAIWPGIEAALQKQKKRRWLIWFFLILALCGGASVWVYYQQNITQEQLDKANALATIIKKEKPRETFRSTNGEIYNGIKKNEAKTATLSPLIKTSPVSPHYTPPTILAKRNRGAMPVKPVAGITNDSLTDAPGNAKQNHQVPISSNIPRASKINLNQKTSDAVTAVNTLISDTTTLPIHPEPNEPVLAEVKTPIINFPSGESIEKATVKIKKNKWLWNLSVIAGSSGTRRAVGFSIKNDAYARDPANGGFAFSQGSGIPANGIINQPSQYQTPTIRDAYSFSINVGAVKQAGKKHRIGFSLGYGLYQNRIGIGNRVDSTVFINSYNVSNSNGFFYRSTDSISYTNRYHYLQAAFSLYTPFRLFRTLSLQWQVGTGMNILLASNALQYASSNNLLFYNRSLLRTMQVDFSTGINLSMGKPAFLFIGPQWQYFLSDLSTHAGSNQHLFRSSVKCTIVLPGKKK